MIFSSIIFLFWFLPIALFVNFIIPKRFQNGFLIFASLLFYAWGENEYVLILISSILINYVLGMWVEFSGTKYAVLLSVAINLTMLGYFKYTGFIMNNSNIVLSWVHVQPILINRVHLPIGISFFTFQAISYLIDIYRKKINASSNPMHIGLHLAFFPHLIAGPIVRYQDDAEQIQSRSVTLEGFAGGAQRFIIGLGKKVLIANTLAPTADKIFSIPIQDMTTLVAWLGIVCYTLFIYFDFSGYSDMAIGLGRMFGFHILENFNFPYISQSIKEMWTRWHISMSTWFRDYLYFPLGGNRNGVIRTYLNLLIVFFLSGLWHGASWNFVIWGMVHGFFLVLERMGFDKVLDRLWRPIRHIYALTVIMVAWVFFRMDHYQDALHFTRAMFGFSTGDCIVQNIGLYWNRELALAITFGILFSMPVSIRLKHWKEIIQPSIGPIRLIVTGCFDVFLLLGLAALMLASLIFLSSDAYNPFLYLRF